MPTSETLNRTKIVVRKSLKLDTALPLDDRMPLVAGDYDIDSLDILLIVTELEKEFGISIKEGTMNAGAFATIESLAAFVERLMPQPN